MRLQLEQLGEAVGVHRPGAAEGDHACSGAGRLPFSAMYMRVAAAMFSLTMLWMPAAASSTLHAEGLRRASARWPSRTARDRAPSRRRGNSPARDSRAAGRRRSRSAPCRRGRSRPGRARRRRCRGRPSAGPCDRRGRSSRRRRRSRSGRSTGTLSGRPEPLRKRRTRAASNSWACSGAPFSIRHILAVVPPMSNEMTGPRPISLAVERSRHRAGRRTGLDQADRETRRAADRRDAAARQHDVERAVEPISRSSLRAAPDSSCISGCT